MAYLKKHFRWGLSVIAILYHFTTPELRALLRHCRKLIKDYCNGALEGEGYGASIIPFEMFEYGWVFAYDHDDEIWVLEVVTFPDWDSPHCKRRRPPESGALQRTIENLESAQLSELSWLIEDLKEMLYETRAVGPILTKFWGDIRKFWNDIGTGGRVSAVMEMLHKIRMSRAPEQSAAASLPVLKELAEQQSHDYSDLVQLMLAKVNDAVGFLRPLWTLPSRRTLRATRNELWDVSLFGAPEQGSG